MTAPSQPAGPKINVPEGMEPAYVNLARISHSPADLVIDLAHLLPDLAEKLSWSCPHCRHS